MIIITRHAGLVQWLADNGIVGHAIEHAAADDVSGQDVVGALPLHLAALATSVTVVDMPGLTAEQRGRDLTPAEMDAAGATLRTYTVRESVQPGAPPIEWTERGSGGGNTWAVLLTAQGKLKRGFANFVERIGGWETMRYSPKPGETVLLLYRSGSGRTESVIELTGAKREWDSWQRASDALGVDLRGA